MSEPLGSVFQGRVGDLEAWQEYVSWRVHVEVLESLKRNGGLRAGTPSLSSHLSGLTPGLDPATLMHVLGQHQAESSAVGEKSLRIGIAYPGDPNAPGTWSGTPASLGNAIRELGANVEPLRAQPPRAVEWFTTQMLTALRLHRTSIKPASQAHQRKPN